MGNSAELHSCKFLRDPLGNGDLSVLRAPGLASLWCLAHAAFQVADIASRAQRAPKSPDQTEIDIGQEFASRQIDAHIAYAEALFHADQNWRAKLFPTADRRRLQFS